MRLIYCLFEDKVSDFHPLVHLRPVFDLACGALTIRQKWERRLGSGAFRILVREELHEFRARPDYITAGNVTGGVWMINGRVIPDGRLAADGLSALGHLPEVRLSGGDLTRAKNGGPLQAARKGPLTGAGFIRLKDAEGRLFGIGKMRNDSIKIERLFNL